MMAGDRAIGQRLVWTKGGEGGAHRAFHEKHEPPRSRSEAGSSSGEEFTPSSIPRHDPSVSQFKNLSFVGIKVK